MSRILIIQSAKLLQQALVYALAPEHEIKLTDQISDDTVPDADIAIVATGALADRSLTAVRPLDAISGWRIPVVWLGSEPPAVEARPGKFVMVQPPLNRESLKKALAEVSGLSQAAAPKPRRGAIDTKPTAPEKETGVVAAEKKKVIELVEVVEEQPGREIFAEAGKKS
jgi:hypothetical protein